MKIIKEDFYKAIVVAEFQEADRQKAAAACYELAKQMQPKWIPVSERLPENIGCYLCLFSDGWQAVCFINALGQWMLRPGGAYYGDLSGADKNHAKRDVTHWQPLPTPPTI